MLGHVVRNADKKLLGVTNVDKKNRFRRDFFVLQLATSPAEFKYVWPSSKPTTIVLNSWGDSSIYLENLDRF